MVEEKITLPTIFSAARNRPFLIFVLLCIVLFLSMGQMGSTLSVFSVDRAGFSLEQFGKLLTLNGLVVVAFQYPMARLTSKLRHSSALALGSLFYAAGWMMMGFVGPYALAVASMFVITLGEITVAPTSLAVVGEHSPPGLRGRYQGLFSISETMGISVGPFMGGILLDVFTTSGLPIWGIIGSFALAAAAGFLIWGRWQRNLS
jgi:MFS family permease